MEFQASIGFQVETCCSSGCGISFAVPKTFYERKRADHSSFYCPNGHSQSYVMQSDAEVERSAKRKLELDMQAKLNEANHARLVAEAAVTKEKRAHSRTKKRIAGGACPCCNRSFADLHAHMKTKHKGYIDAPKPKQIAGTVQ